MEQVKSINAMYWNGSIFQYCFYASVVLIIVLERNRTKKIVYGFFPLVAILTLLNPITAGIVVHYFDLSTVYYVRVYTIIPVFYCMAHAVTLILDRIRTFVKPICVLVALVAIVWMGHSIYQEPWMQKAINPEKVPEDMMEVINVIPRNSADVCVAFPDPLYLYARQIDATIRMPYGRWTGSTKYSMQLLDLLNQPKPDVLQTIKLAGSEGADYIVINKNDEARGTFSAEGYEPVGETSHYLVYPVTGVPKTALTVNNKRQIVSVTTYDSSGKPAYSGNSVIATKSYEYDRWGNKIKEVYFDKDGKRVTTTEGYSAIQRRYKLLGLSWGVDSVSYFDSSDKPVLVSGRYETRYTYTKGKKTAKESYFDFEGRPMCRLDLGYAETLKEYDAHGRLTREKFNDESGNPVISTEGYAGYTRQYDDGGRIILEKYFDTQGTATNCKAGFAEWTRAYDDTGRVIDEAFKDASGNMVDVRTQLLNNWPKNLLQLSIKTNVENGVGVSYLWNEEGLCTIRGKARGISWNDVLMGEKPFYLFEGETYSVQYSSEKAMLQIAFYDDTSWNNQLNSVDTYTNAEFTVPENCGAVIVRLKIDPGETVNETVCPRIAFK